MKNSIKTNKVPGTFLTPEQFRDFLLSHLDRIYCAKSHLHERLPELAEQANFSDLRNAIRETWEDIGKQIARIEEIYVLMEEDPSLTNCDELIKYVERGFDPIHYQSSEPGPRDMAILFYLSIIESIEQASFLLLEMAAVNMADKRIKQLLKENYDESKADRVLFLQIAAIYVS